MTMKSIYTKTETTTSKTTPGVSIKSESTTKSTAIVTTDDQKLIRITKEEYHGSLSTSSADPNLDRLDLRPTQKRRLKSEDWFTSDDHFSNENECDVDISPSSFQDNASETDFETSALSSFSSLEDSFLNAFDIERQAVKIKNPTINAMPAARARPEMPIPFIPSLNHPPPLLQPLSLPVAPVVPYIIPTDKDVLLGRGGMTNNHAGNKRYREEVQKLKPWYQSLDTKQQKKELSQLMVDYVRDYGGRFLQKDNITQQWVEASPQAARKKASQALRESKVDGSKNAEEQYDESPG